MTSGTQDGMSSCGRAADRMDIGLHSPPRSRTTLPPLPALVIAEAILSAASRSGSSARWAYLCVVRAWVCPSSRPINGRLSPPPAPVAAKVCRKIVDADIGQSRMRADRIPAVAQLLQWLTGLLARERRSRPN